MISLALQGELVQSLILRAGGRAVAPACSARARGGSSCNSRKIRIEQLGCLLLLGARLGSSVKVAGITVCQVRAFRACPCLAQAADSRW